MEQEPDQGNDTPTEEEVRPFPRVGDVVRYKGKWKNEISFGEVRQLVQV